ncbi:MAG TPA: hypothetical protein VIU39_08360 [Anaerolineales bacterium]
MSSSDTMTVGCRVTRDQNRVLEYLALQTDRKKADLILEALEAQYRLSERSEEVRSFFKQGGYKENQSG